MNRLAYIAANLFVHVLAPYTGEMARQQVETKVYKISMAAESVPLLEALARLGIYGKSPPEIIRRFAEEGLERVVYKDHVLDTAGISVPGLVSKKTRGAVPRKK